MPIDFRFRDSQDILAHRPAASPFHQLFWATDLDQYYRSDGQNWWEIGNVGGRVFSPFAYGAVGDNVTDDYAAFQRMADAVTAYGGYCTVDIPSVKGGGFALSATPIFDADGILCQGHGYGSYLRSTQHDQSCLQFGTDISTLTRRYGIVVTNIRFQQTQDHLDDNNPAVRSFYTADMKVMQNWFTSCFGGNSFYHGGVAAPDRRSWDCVSAFNIYHETKNMGTEFFHVLRGLDIGNIKTATGTNGASHGTRINASERVVSVLNQVDGHHDIVTMEGSDYLIPTGNAFCYRLLVLLNVGANLGNNGIYGFNDIRDAVIEYNKIFGFGIKSAFACYGIDGHLDAVGSWSNWKVRHNDIDCLGTGATDAPVHLADGTGYEVTDNNFFNLLTDENAFLGSNNGGKKICSKNRAVVAGGGQTGQFLGAFNDTTSGTGETFMQNNWIMAPSGTRANKIRASGSSTFTYRDGNSFDSNFYTDENGVVTLTANRGVTAGNISDGGTIPHGLTGAPTWYDARPTLAGHTSAVTSVNGTNLTVSLKKDDGTAGTPQPMTWAAAQ